MCHRISSTDYALIDTTDSGRYGVVQAKSKKILWVTRLYHLLGTSVRIGTPRIYVKKAGLRGSVATFSEREDIISASRPRGVRRGREMSGDLCAALFR